MLRCVSGGLAALCLAFLSACTWGVPPPQLEEAASATFQRLHAGDSDAILRDGAPVLADAADTLSQISSLLPREAPAEIHRVGYSSSHAASDPESQHRLTYEYRWPDDIALINLSYEQAGPDAPFVLNGFTFRIATREELAANDFNLAGKPPGHYAMLAAIIVSPLLMIAAFVLALRAPGLERRWLWCILSLVTVCLFRLDWTNNASQFVLITAGLINVGVTRADSLFASWVLSAGLPVGALIVLVRLWLFRPRDQAKADASAPEA